MHGGAVSGKGGFSLVSVYCSEIHCCARSNVTVMTNVTEVPGKCKFWVNIVPDLLWNRITVLRLKMSSSTKECIFLPCKYHTFWHVKSWKEEKKTCTSGIYNFIITFLLKNILYVRNMLYTSWVARGEVPHIICWKVSSLKLQSNKGILVSETP